MVEENIPHVLAKVCHYCLSLNHMTSYASTHEISGRRPNNLLVCPVKESQSWSHMSTRTGDGNYLKEPFLIHP